MKRDNNSISLTTRVVRSISEIPEPVWNQCTVSSHPFILYNFLLSLEESKSAVPETGWTPQHLLLYSKSEVIGTMPMYIKEHSAGEYVFDHGWAEAFHRAGGRYYPKLQVSVPFTPVTGPRLLISPDFKNQDEGKRTLALAATEHCKKIGASSLHFTFPTKQESKLLGDIGMLRRTGIQFHWRNLGYKSFDDFLTTLSSSKRKQIRRERRGAIESGIKISVLSGDDIKDHHWDSFYLFYTNTSLKKWGTPYLTREFFSLIGKRISNQIILVLAERDGLPIAGALNFLGNNTIYGRNWGCIEEHKFLHFEVCFYRIIDFAITNKIKKVEAGAQGPHKLSRGYLPIATYSNHWIEHKGLRHAISQYLSKETTALDWEIKALEEHSPFRKI